jgi:bacillithiol biosynthesis cysteine-adding enzyme BshC
MQAKLFPDVEYRKLNQLVYAYCIKNPNTQEFFECEPELSKIAQAANQRSFPHARYAVLSNVLLEQYQHNLPIDAVQENLKAIETGSAVTVATGHQLCMLGGPAYLFYKIVSTIKLAQNLQPLLSNKKVVPVFWMAGEDHDKDEINHAFLKGSRIVWDTHQTGPVGRFSLDGFEDVLSSWMNSIEDENLRQTLGSIWNRAMQAQSWVELTKSWIHDCFGEWGLVVINPDDARLKQFFLPVMKRELLHEVAFAAVSHSNKKLTELGYHPQVNPREINLFYMSHQSRVRIERIEDKWRTIDDSRTWSESELLLELDGNPENFSPNVLLRPLYQETILPNVAYVGGPGELAYWLQLKSLFREYEIPMPALVLRDAVILISQAANRRLSKLGLSSDQLLNEKSQLVEALAGMKPDFSSEKQDLIQVFERLAVRIAAVDPTLRAASMAEAQKALSGVDQLQAKTWKATKTREEQKLAALDKIWEEIYPENNWQERTQNIFLEAFAENKKLLHLLLEVFRPPSGTLVIVEP